MVGLEARQVGSMLDIFDKGALCGKFLESRQNLKVVHFRFFYGALSETHHCPVSMIQELDKCCPTLRTLLLHISPINSNKSYVSVAQVLSPKGPTAIALRILGSHLDRLSIVTSGAWSRLEVFRQSIMVDGSLRVEEILDARPPISLIPGRT